LNIDYYPQYSPASDIINIPTNINIEIDYIPPEVPLFNANSYDMLIITDEKFVSQLQPLVDHKNNIGISTILDTTQNIYPNYDGRDDAEDIKLCIKDAIENWGIKYVLLAGGRKGQTYEWYVPERRSNTDDGADYETGYSSDLYFADIYKYMPGGLLFEDWDSDGDGIFSEFYAGAGGPEDIIDYYPDVYVGRIPFRYSWEVDIVVDKIINYENNADDSWFKKVVAIGGDTSPPARGNVDPHVYEGEIATGVTANILDNIGFEVTKLRTSDGSFSCSEDVQNAISQGCGWVHFAGHANPALWGNFLPDAETESEFIYGVTFLDIAKGAYSNGNKLPVMIIGGCHTCQFNVSMQQILTENGLDSLHRLEWIPTDFSSWFLLQGGGGSIASLGPTGLGWGYVNEYVTLGLGGWLDPRFAHAYAVQNKDILGETWGTAIKDYINIIGHVNEDRIDRKTIEETVLLGDPSLKIGGVGIATIGIDEDKKDSHIDSDIVTSSLSVDVPTWEIGTVWTYKLNNIDFTLSETEGRYVDFHLNSGNIKLEVIEETADLYCTEISTDALDVTVDIDFDYYMDDKEPTVLELNFENATLEGNIYFDKDNLGISEINAKLSIIFDSSSFPIELPSIIIKLVPMIPIEVNIEVDFDQPYVLLNFPLDVGTEWGIPSGNITIDGTVQSIWLKVLYYLNKLTRIVGIELIPPGLEQFLPVIDISEVLESYGYPSAMAIPEVEESFRRAPFICSDQKTVSVPAGAFNVYVISILSGMGDIYYSPEVGNIVKFSGYLGNFIPYMDNIDLELVSVSS